MCGNSSKIVQNHISIRVCVSEYTYTLLVNILVGLTWI